MKTVVLLFIVILPMITALTSSYWFWHLRYLRKLKPARAMDNEAIQFPGPLLTLSEIRHYDKGQVGEKIVIVHHLVSAAEDAQDKLIQDWFRITLVNASFILFAVLWIFSKSSQLPPTTPQVSPSQTVQSLALGVGASQTRAPGQTPNTGQTPSTGQTQGIASKTNFGDAMALVGEQAIVMYGVPISMLAFVLNYVFIISYLRDQVRKYRRVLGDV